VSLWLFAVLLPVMVFILNFLLKPANSVLFWMDCAVFILISIAIIIKVKEQRARIFALSCVSVLFAGIYLNTILYNEIVPYKGEIAAARYINQKPFDNVNIYSSKSENNIFKFYCKRPVCFLPIDQLEKFHPKKPSVFYASQQSLDY